MAKLRREVYPEYIALNIDSDEGSLSGITKKPQKCGFFHFTSVIERFAFQMSILISDFKF
jgi:hypothetical protein